MQVVFFNIMQEILKTLKILSVPARLRIFSLLQKEELSVNELQGITHMGQSCISTHLSLLQECGLLEFYRKGKNNFYKFADNIPQEVKTLVDIALNGTKELPEYQSDRSNLKRVLDLRNEHAKLFFNQVAGRFDRIYGPGRSWQAFGQLLLKMLPPVTIADLGSGEGLISELLAQNAKKVIAVDNSPKIIKFGIAQAKKANIKNIEFRLGDIQNPPIEPGSIDIAVLSQVLHHLENPRPAIEAAYRILKPGGSIFILDLFKHNFTQAHELYGDTHLGFSDGDIHRMLEKTGFAGIDISLASQEENPPHLQTLLAFARK